MGFDHKLLIPVDLSKNPNAYIAGTIPRSEIQVDDQPTDGGLTKLGPTWPTGSTINGLWLDSVYYDNLRTKPQFPQRFMDCEAYELMTVVYWQLAARGIAQRYWGFFVELTAEQGPLALCTIWTPGTSRTQRPAGSWWLDLASQADSIANGFTTVGVGAGVPKRGALFINANTVRGLGLSGPKIPPWLGGQSFPLQKR